MLFTGFLADHKRKECASTHRKLNVIFLEDRPESGLHCSYPIPLSRTQSCDLTWEQGVLGHVVPGKGKGDWMDTQYSFFSFPGDAVGKNPPANAGVARNAGLIPGLGRFPWNRKWQAPPVFLPGKFHGQVGYRGPKDLDMTEHISMP